MLTEAAFINNIYKKKQKMFSRPFSFLGRIRRLEYCISIFIWLILCSNIIGADNSSHLIAYFITFPIYDLIWLMLFIITNNSFFYLILLLPISWFVIAQGIKRCHDLGRSGWYQLVPFYVLRMLFEEGDPYINKYGHNPK